MLFRSFSHGITAPSFSGSGGGLTGLDASKLSSGTAADARLSANIPRKSASSNRFQGKLLALGFGGLGTGGSPAFTGAGSAIIPAGKRRVTIDEPAMIGPGRHVVVSLESDPGANVAIRNTVRSPGKIDIFLTGNVAKDTEVAYFIFRRGT